MDAADDETVAETGIKELEAAIDDAVYDLFELSDEEREVVEAYLDVFESKMADGLSDSVTKLPAQLLVDRLVQCLDIEGWQSVGFALTEEGP